MPERRVSNVHMLGVYIIIAALIIVLGLVWVNERNLSIAQDAAKQTSQLIEQPAASDLGLPAQ